MKELIIGKNDAGQRADKFLTKALVDLPTSLLYKYLRTKKIKLNGKRLEASNKLCEGDILTLYISDEFFPTAINDAKTRYLSEKLTLFPDEIIYEDDNIIIIDKKSGITVHPNTENEMPTGRGEIYLTDKILGYLVKKNEYDPTKENSFCPALCNRLDRNTAGLIIAAKNAESLRIMNQKIKDRELKKLYYCEAEGIFSKKFGTLSDYLYKDKQKNRVFIFKSREEAKKVTKTRFDDDIKTVITKYKVIAEHLGNSLVLVDLITGRTHQIRAHLAYYGHPLIGDGKYGKVHTKKESDMHQTLYSHTIIFDFKTDGGILAYLDKKKFEGHTQEFMKKYGL